MNINKTINTQQRVTIFLSTLMIVCSTAVFSQEADNETSIADDIFIALTLQGINCDGISELEQNEEDSYDVVCQSGGRFSISQTKNGILTVVDKITGVVRKGIGIFLGAVPMTGQMFQQSDELNEHDAEVARSLFSITVLSGNTCESITNIVSSANDEHIVSCANGYKYRVFTREDGLVAVEVVLVE